MVKLIIFDLYGTLTKADDHDGVIRPGFWELYDYYKKAKKAVFTDGESDYTRFNLSRMGLIKKFNRIYNQNHCRSEGGVIVKDLEIVCKELGVSRKNAVFIGDNYQNTDAKSAKLSKIKFIRIPQYRQSPPTPKEREEMGPYVEFEDEKPFTLASLIKRL